MISSQLGEKHYMNIANQNTVKIVTNWWPVSDEEWERLNYPEKFNRPVDKQQEKK